MSESGLEISASESGTTLQAFAGVVASEVAHGISREAIEAAARGESEKLAGWAQGMTLDGMQGHLAGKVVELLQNDAVEMFAGAWCKFAELKKSAAETRLHPEGSASVLLSEHEFSYELAPEVDVRWNGALLGKFVFAVKLLCTVSALELLLKNGAVTTIDAGHAEGETAIALAGHEVWKKAFVHADLPGTLSLNRPVAIG